MEIELYNVPGKVVGKYHLDINTIIDSWSSLNISFEDWKSNIYEIGILDFAAKNEVTAWVTDTSNSEGVFRREIQEFRENVSAEAMAKSGVMYFFTVLQSSAIAKLSGRRVSKAYSGQGQMKSLAVESLEEAFELIKKELQ